MKVTFLLVFLPFTGKTLATPVRQVILQGIVFDAAQFPAEYAVNEQRLLEFKDGSNLKMWMTELDKIKLKANGTRFFDITETPDISTTPSFISAPTITSLKYNETISKVTKTLSTNGPEENLKNFSSFYNRYYRSDITDEYASSELRNLISIKEFDHSWAQKSIIAKIAGGSADNETIIIGAHQDSYNLMPYFPAPGAGDDGSGTVTILEAYRGNLANGIKPKKNIEFHWYSAEEGGLLGSQAVAQQYSRDQISVVAMIQMDMTAWVKRGVREEIGNITDFVDYKLTQILRELVRAYTSLPSVGTQCGYGCSDHASWTKANFPSCATLRAFENINPHIHSGDDKIDISDEFSFEHMLQFSKLAVVFAIELGELDD